MRPVIYLNTTEDSDTAHWERSNNTANLAWYKGISNWSKANSDVHKMNTTYWDNFIEKVLSDKFDAYFYCLDKVNVKPRRTLICYSLNLNEANDQYAHPFSTSFLSNEFIDSRQTINSKFSYGHELYHLTLNNFQMGSYDHDYIFNKIYYKYVSAINARRKKFYRTLEQAEYCFEHIIDKIKQSAKRNITNTIKTIVKYCTVINAEALVYTCNFVFLFRDRHMLGDNGDDEHNNTIKIEALDFYRCINLCLPENVFHEIQNKRERNRRREIRIK